MIRILQWLRTRGKEREVHRPLYAGLDDQRLAIAAGTAPMTPKVLYDVVLGQDTASEDEDPGDYRDRWAAPWLEIATPDWLDLAKELLLATAPGDSHLDLYLDLLWLFTEELGERFPEHATATFGPLVDLADGPRSDIGFFAITLLGTWGQESALEWLTGLIARKHRSAGVEAALARALQAIGSERALEVLRCLSEPGR